jgi:hypothetical protein
MVKLLCEKNLLERMQGYLIFPGAAPHLTLGYSIVSPVFIADKLAEKRNQKA